MFVMCPEKVKRLFDRLLVADVSVDVAEQAERGGLARMCRPD